MDAALRKVRKVQSGSFLYAFLESSTALELTHWGKDVHLEGFPVPFVSRNHGEPRKTFHEILVG